MGKLKSRSISSLGRVRRATLDSPVATLQLKSSTRSIIIWQEPRYTSVQSFERMKLTFLFSVVFQLLILVSDVEAKRRGGLIIIFTENGSLSGWGVLILIATLSCTICGCIRGCMSQKDEDSDSNDSYDNV